MSGRWLPGMVGLIALATAGSARAAELVQLTVQLSSELWALNGDLVRQPLVPLMRKLAVPTVTVSDRVVVTPPKGAVTQIASFPADFGGGATITFSRTTGGRRIVLAKPTNKHNPFTARIKNRIGNGPGSVLFNPADPSWSAELPVDIAARLDFDLGLASHLAFFLDLTLNGAIGVSGGTAPIVGSITYIGVAGYRGSSR